MKNAFTSVTVTLFILSAIGMAEHALASYTIDGAHAFASFRVNHLGMGESQGMFLKVEGSIDDKKSIHVKIDADSIFTGNKKRDDHLKGADFLNAKQFPTLTFKSESLKAKGEKQYAVTGTLTLRGVSKKITINATRIGGGKDPWGKERVGYVSEFTIDRMDYGIAYSPDGIGKDVTFRIAIEAVR
jgi:polyisoprenoid-binding protein YceI